MAMRSQKTYLLIMINITLQVPVNDLYYFRGAMQGADATESPIGTAVPPAKTSETKLPETSRRDSMRKNMEGSEIKGSQSGWSLSRGAEKTTYASCVRVSQSIGMAWACRHCR